MFHVRGNIDDAVEVTVAESQPTLRLAASLDDEALFLRGRLMANGVPVTGQRVGVDVDGVVRKKPTTNAEGRYGTCVPRETGGAGYWQVSADYNRTDSNLAPVLNVQWLYAARLNVTPGTSQPSGVLLGVAARRVADGDGSGQPSASLVWGGVLTYTFLAGLGVAVRRTTDN